MGTPRLELRKYQLFKVALRLKSQAFTGSLVLEEADGKTAIYFDNGQPVHAASTQVNLSFPAFLLRKRRIERDQLKGLLEESASRGVRLEEVLVSRGLLGTKEVARLKRELSAFVFTMSFQKDRCVWREEPADRPALDVARAHKMPSVHEGLFRAVAGDSDTALMSRMFTEQWDSSLDKSADFYRYLIPFRSVFYGEDITDLLMEEGVTAQSLMDAAVDKESALRQLFALCFTGMVTFQAGDVRVTQDADAPQPDSADPGENRTIVIMPEEVPTEANVTAFFGAGSIPFQPRRPENQPAPQGNKSEVDLFLEEGFTANPASLEEDTNELLEAALEPIPDGPSLDRERAAPQHVPRPGPLNPDTMSAPAPISSPEPNAAEDEAEDTPDTSQGDVAEPDDPAAPPGMENAVTREPPAEDGAEDRDAEALLQRAMEAAERVVADAGRVPDPTPAPQPAPPEPTALPEPGSGLLAGASPPPMPERDAEAEPGTDESIERILEDVYRGMLSRNLYQILNVGPTSPLSAVRDSANRLRAKYSPEQYRAYMLSGRARRLLQYVGQQIERAETVLSHREERLAYDRQEGTDYGQDARSAINVMFDAEEAYQEGMGSAAAGNWSDALEHFTRAVAKNPRDADYLAHKGWATFRAQQEGQSNDQLAPSKARNILERALSVDARSANALLFLGRLEKEQNNVEAARGWYERLHKLSPHNDEANAALEWLRMSSGIQRKPEESGFWNWLKRIFKNK